MHGVACVSLITETKWKLWISSTSGFRDLGLDFWHYDIQPDPTHRNRLHRTFFCQKKGMRMRSSIWPFVACRLLSSHYVALRCVVVSIYFFFPPATKNWHASATSVRVPLAYAYTYYALCYDPSPPPRMFARCKRDRAYYSEFSFRPIGRFAWLRIWAWIGIYFV